jgi:hypothetical protein
VILISQAVMILLMIQENDNTKWIYGRKWIYSLLASMQ